ncbi:SMC-Scp complex subunit ScpB [Actinoplanes sp. NPDC023714]|uniref:SMC-Scp complex subunit ScpB n=1 Tax=Actinoplanes sp. NPDC023714 TaxID=3154322 RepID=UPI0033CA1077
MVSSEEREDSLAAQAAAWVPPWERRREPDRDYQDAVDAPQDIPEDEDEPDPEPTEEEVGPELPLPDPIEEADEPVFDEPAPDDEPHVPVDAPASTLAGPPLDLDDPHGDGPAAVHKIGEVGGGEVAPAGPAGDLVDSGGGGAAADHKIGERAVAAVPAQATGARDRGDVGDGSARTQAALDDADLAAALESIMLVVDEPVGELQLAQVMEVPVERIARTLEDVSARYTAAGHGIDLRRVAGGWRLYTRPEYASYVERFVLDGQSVRLTQAALETLSVVAYKQPVTRSRISAIRGVNCDGVMRTLVTRGLIEEVGTEPETGAYLYRTTVLFLEKLGLNSVDQLPPLAPFLPDDVEEVLDASG